MSSKNMRITNGRLGAALNVLAKPGASCNQIAGINSDGTLVVELDCELGADQVNVCLVRYFSELFRVSPEDIEIVAGEQGVKKIVSILDVSSEYINQVIQQTYP